MFNQPLADFDALKIELASPETMRKWSFGEVMKPETINYRTQKPEKGGLFAEEIFGPTKDWECYCGKYRKIRYKGIICDKCGVEVTHSLVRRERMAHIELAAPVSHIWFLRSIPSKLGLILDMSMQNVEKVIYFAMFVVTDVDKDLKMATYEQLKSEYKGKKKQIENDLKRKLDQLEKGEAKYTQVEAEEEMEQKMESLDEEFAEADASLKLLEPLRLITEHQYQEMSLRYGHLFDAAVGAEAIQLLLQRLDLDATIKELEEALKTAPKSKKQRMVRRTQLLKGLHRQNIKPEWMILTVVPVIPPDLRPMVALDGGRYATSDVNDLYRRVINRNNRLKRLRDLNAPEIIVRNEKRMLQEAADALIDNSARHTKTVTNPAGSRRQLRSMADTLKGKQGRFLQNLLGKRTDYSGRSVIVVGPYMKIDQCGIPKRMALELFKPFIMSKIISRGIAHNIRSASKVIESERPEVWDILEEVTKTRYVLLNRAPTLHRLGIQAFRPRLIEGKAIQLHPLVCTAFNADFDGDQMAVHVPLTEEAKWEAENLMSAAKNLLRPANGTPIVTPKQDIALGSFYLTSCVDEDKDDKECKRFADVKEAFMAYQMGKIGLQDKIGVRFANRARFTDADPAITMTTVGRTIFNGILTDEFPYYNHAITSKGLGDVLHYAIETVGTDKAVVVLDGIKALGFKYVTKAGHSLSMDDFMVVPDKKELIAEGNGRVEEIEEQYAEGLLTAGERHIKIIEVWDEIKKRIVKNVRNQVPVEGAVYGMIESGARGTWGQLTQVVGMKGLVSNPAGEIIELPVKGSFKEGFEVIEFFISTHGSRKGLTDTALRTANAGYLTRRLVDVSQDIVIRSDDCGDEEGVTLSAAESDMMGEKLSSRIWGRYIIDPIKDGRKTLVKADTLIDEELKHKLADFEIPEVRYRSILTCKMNKGVCKKCYGFDHSKNKLVATGTAVGIIAAQSIGEPGTQLTMRTFHTGGVAGGADITRGLPRVEELFEARNPKRRAFVADVAGKVTVETIDRRVIEGPDGKRILEGKAGQRIVRVTYRDTLTDEFKRLKSDDLKVEDGGTISKGEVLMEHKDGTTEVAEHTGIVTEVKSKAIITYEGDSVKEYVIPAGYKILAKDGTEAMAGDALTDGSLELQQLFELKGEYATAKYILKEIQSIYTGQGQKLRDKHIEVIIRQMFSRRYIEDAGDTEFLPGDVVERSQFNIENERVTESKGTLAEGKPLFLGISKVSLSTQSLLSAASFQETAKVLIGAAVSGKVDTLDGLKENVIIGRLIPAGTGYEGSPLKDDLDNAMKEMREERAQIAAAEEAERRAAVAAEMAANGEGEDAGTDELPPAAPAEPAAVASSGDGAGL